MTSINIINRIAAAAVGGYAFTWGMCAFGIAALVSLGVAYDQAELALMILATLIYLSVFLWSFAAKRMLLVWGTLAGGGTLLTFAALALQQSITVY